MWKWGVNISEAIADIETSSLSTHTLTITNRQKPIRKLISQKKCGLWITNSVGKNAILNIVEDC